MLFLRLALKTQHRHAYFLASVGLQLPPPTVKQVVWSWHGCDSLTASAGQIAITLLGGSLRSDRFCGKVHFQPRFRTQSSSRGSSDRAMQQRQLRQSNVKYHSAANLDACSCKSPPLWHLARLLGDAGGCLQDDSGGAPDYGPNRACQQTFPKARNRAPNPR